VLPRRTEVSTNRRIVVNIFIIILKCIQMHAMCEQCSLNYDCHRTLSVSVTVNLTFTRVHAEIHSSRCIENIISADRCNVSIVAKVPRLSWHYQCIIVARSCIPAVVYENSTEPIIHLYVQTHKSQLNKLQSYVKQRSQYYRWNIQQIPVVTFSLFSMHSNRFLVQFTKSKKKLVPTRLAVYR